ncbi:MAG: hypothetical protein HQ481_17965 [Alphaproteobacteria bacterium]|nr:hypothetical protein [Alphaproteobacteria bacterium]
MSDVMLRNRLLSRVGTIVAPERPLLSRYFLAVDSDMRRLGVTLSVDENMDQFEAVCRETGKFVPNAFRPGMTPIVPGEALWFQARDAENNLIATFAVRCYRLPQKTLGDWLSTGALFYENPIQQMPEGERFFLGAEADAYARTIRHSCTFIGGLAITDDYRGRTNLAEVMTTLGCAIAMAHWDAAPMISIAEDEVFAKNQDKYRFDVACPGVFWYRPHKPHRTCMWLLARTRGAVLNDLVEFLDTDSVQRVQVRSMHEPALMAAAQ